MYTAYLVDDEPLALKGLSGAGAWLEHGFEVVGQSTDPIEAAEQIGELMPDVVFTDVKMPGITGLELIEKLRSDGLDAEFVVISAYGDYAFVRGAMLAGGFDYLLKPVEHTQFDALLSRLTKTLETKKPRLSERVTPCAELNDILAYLRRHIARKHTLTDISRRFGLSPNHICALFSKHLSTTFIAYLQDIRMAGAADYLSRTDKAVKEIAALCGYGDYFYFCKSFKAFFGMTPTQYRHKGAPS